MNYRDFWTGAHKARDQRWLAFSEPTNVVSRLGVNLDGVKSILEVGPGILLVADYLESIGKRVVVHDIVTIDDPRYVAELPLKEKVDAALAHLVLQHVPAKDHHRLVGNIVASLKPGGCFYFDAVTDNTSANPALELEYRTGTSFPFTAWDLVTSKREVDPGYFFCIARAA